MADTKKTNQTKEFLVVKGGYIEYNLPPAKRRIISGKWGTAMPQTTKYIAVSNTAPHDK